MAAVTKLEIVKKGYNHQVVEYLESILEQAKAGDIIEMCCCHKFDTGGYSVSYTGCSDLNELVGQLERMKFLTLRRMDA
jgi:hypothetical protein